MATGTATYLRRWADRALDELLAELPALLIVGPRASGKTTTAARRAATTVRLDVPAQAAAFAADPDAALRGLAEPVLLDEWQEVPAVLGAVKRAVDADGRPGRFLLTGSVSAPIDHRLWQGTGRLLQIAMHPMAIRELRGAVDGPAFLDRLADGGEPPRPADPPDLRGYVELALRGGFPTPALRLGPQAGRRWLEGYVDELIKRDVPHATGRAADPLRLRRYVEAYALSSGGIADHRTIYAAAGITKVTALAYEGLAAQLRPELAVARSRPRLHHLRSKGGRQEVGLLAELAGQRVVGIEVKATAAPTRADARHLAWLRDELGARFAAGVVLHTGPRVFRLDDGIVAAPIAALWA